MNILFKQNFRGQEFFYQELSSFRLSETFKWNRFCKINQRSGIWYYPSCWNDEFHRKNGAFLQKSRFGNRKLRCHWKLQWTFSMNPQVNGLNRREICAYMKEIGLSENLKSVGIFNYNIYSENQLNHQLLAQMIWYLIEGINIQRSHPKERHYEIFYVLIDDRQYAFKRDTFSNLWYFGDDEDIENCIPCSRKDFDEAKKGWLSTRFTKM